MVLCPDADSEGSCLSEAGRARPWQGDTLLWELVGPRRGTVLCLPHTRLHVGTTWPETSFRYNLVTECALSPTPGPLSPLGFRAAGHSPPPPAATDARCPRVGEGQNEAGAGPVSPSASRVRAPLRLSAARPPGARRSCRSPRGTAPAGPQLPEARVAGADGSGGGVSGGPASPAAGTASERCREKRGPAARRPADWTCFHPRPPAVG